MISQPPVATELQRWVRRLTDADLILTADGEALNAAPAGVWGAAAGNDEQAQAFYLKQFIRTLEALVANGDLPAAEAFPALSEARRALGSI